MPLYIPPLLIAGVLATAAAAYFHKKGNRKRRIFYSFHYKNDAWRTSQVRNIGAVSGSKPASDNDWEKIKHRGDAAIKKWIENQIKNRSCTIVLVGSQTAQRKWVKYEIIKSWEKGMGVAGIYIDGLKGQDGSPSARGKNPFDYIPYKNGRKLSSIVKCHNPIGRNSTSKYGWISRNLSEIVEEAIKIRANHP